ncbi:hypothetical protein MMC26_003632 [Xylographa opegraphella]|nr:hypothetical protein [Xylographa opegraphella]
MWQNHTRTSSGLYHSHSRVPAATAPYIEYPSYRNSAHGNLGFDVSNVMGLVAAATDEGEVKIWDGWTGKERAWGRERYEEGDDMDRLQEGNGWEGNERSPRTGAKEPGRNGIGEVGDLARSLVFVGGGEGKRKGERLLVARRAVVEEWGL